MSNKNDWKGILPKQEEDKMLEMNPYRPSSFWLPTPHEGLNRRYVMAWDRGKFYVLDKLISFMRDHNIPKDTMIDFFRDITEHPDFPDSKTGI